MPKSSLRCLVGGVGWMLTQTRPKREQSLDSQRGENALQMGVILSQFVNAVWDGAGSCSLQGTP